jgi:hypothetical protein
MGEPAPLDVVPVIIKRREPFEIVILALLFISAVTQLLVKQPPQSIAALIPEWYGLDWAILTIFGTGIALVGIWLPELVTGLFVERLGVNVTNMSLVIYGAAVVVFGKAQGLTSFGLILAGIVAFWMRRVEITKAVKRLPTNPTTWTIHHRLANLSRKFRQ